MKSYILIPLFIIIVLASCTYTETPSSSKIGKGAFLIANSWGTNGDWENVPDGKYWITFDDAKKVNLTLDVWAKEINHPKARISFSITHDYRSDCDITIGVGDNSTDLDFSKKFIDLYNPRLFGDATSFDNQYIAVDISEFYPYLNTKNLYIKFYDRDQNFVTREDNATNTIVYRGRSDTAGSITNVALEIWTYSNYLQKPDMSLIYDTVSGSFTDGNTQTFAFRTFNNTLPANSSTRFLQDKTHNFELIMSNPSPRQLAQLKKTYGTYQKDKNYNKIYHNKYGTGFIPPTTDQWKKIASTPSIITRVSKANRVSARSIDHSSEIYFPPIGHQGKKGSCVSFSAGYYIQTYYMAKNYDWDLSGTLWINGIGDAPGQPDSNQDKILSPEFLYNLVSVDFSNGSYNLDNYLILTEIGICSWEKMPYTNTLTWPSRDAFKEAGLYRSTGIISLTANDKNIGAIPIEDDSDIETALILLEKGYLFSCGVKAEYLDTSNFSANDVLLSDKLTGKWEFIDHANTVVGYSLTPNPAEL